MPGKKRPIRRVYDLSQSSDDESKWDSQPNTESYTNETQVGEDVETDHEPDGTTDEPEFAENTESTGGPRCRAWCATIWDADWDSLSCRLRVIGGNLGVKYFCFQQETAPTTGRRHYQAYFRFEQRQRLRGLRDWVTKTFGPDAKARFACANGTDEQNEEYCSKEASGIPGTFQKYGEPKKQGKRTDLMSVAEMIAEGQSVRDVATAFPTQYIKFAKGIEKLHAITRFEHRDPAVPVTVHWWFGPSGVGKSRKAYEKFPKAYRKMMGNAWWDGYAGEKVVVMDDYRASMVRFSLLLNWLDRYPCTVEAKGTSFPLSAVVFVLTTTQRPEVIWHKQTDENIYQLVRRCTEIVEFSSEGETILKNDSTTYVQLTKAEVEEKFFPNTFVMPN
jgi:hypothetical protein